jgi:hypothetical protein
MGKTADAIYVFCEKNWVIPLKNDKDSSGTGIEFLFVQKQLLNAAFLLFASRSEQSRKVAAHVTNFEYVQIHFSRGI